MKLLYQTHSPYARKALVFAHEAGLASDIEVIHQETSPTLRNEEVFSMNPLGKVPVLVRPGMPAIFESDVICAYLDTLHSRRKLDSREWRGALACAASTGRVAGNLRCRHSGALGDRPAA